MKKHLICQLPDKITRRLPKIGRTDQNIYLILNKKIEALLEKSHISAEKRCLDIKKPNKTCCHLKITAVNFREFNQLAPKVKFFLT